MTFGQAREGILATICADDCAINTAGILSGRGAAPPYQQWQPLDYAALAVVNDLAVTARETGRVSLLMVSSTGWINHSNIAGIVLPGCRRVIGITGCAWEPHANRNA